MALASLAGHPLRSFSLGRCAIRPSDLPSSPPNLNIALISQLCAFAYTGRLIGWVIIFTICPSRALFARLALPRSLKSRITIDPWQFPPFSILLSRGSRRGPRILPATLKFFGRRMPPWWSWGGWEALSRLIHRASLPRTPCAAQ